MEYGLFIYTIITYLMLWIRFWKELVMLRLREELPTFARDFHSNRSLQVKLRFKIQIRQVLDIVEGCF